MRIEKVLNINYKYLASLFTILFAAVNIGAQNNAFFPGKVWLDNNGRLINAHGGGIFYHNGTYYWFGEHKGERSNSAWVGVTCYSSTDLYNWKDEGVALSVSKDQDSPIVEGCIIERPKVIFNEKTQKFVMYFHLELRNRGYEAANVGVAVSDNPTGPYRFLKNGRVNAGIWPLNMTAGQRALKELPDSHESWTPKWIEAVKEGSFVRRDFQSGQMSRDMTLYVDDDKKAYHIYASEENLTLQIAELTDDYLDYTGKYVRVQPGGHNEAPAIIKKDGKYFMVTSGCTGWAPNAARLLTAGDIMGEWTLHPNPCVGKDAELTFHSQSTYLLPVQGKKNAFIFMADRWRPDNPIDGRYVWLPLLFENGMPVLKWFDRWDLDIFDQMNPDFSEPGEIAGYQLVWNEEFNYEGVPDPEVWTHEKGYVRNEEYQWYQPDNAVCSNGVLVISGQKEENRKNPNYEPNSRDWRKNREFINYTASSIKTQGKKAFQYGRFEIRARIPTAGGSWPAIWTLGESMRWPFCGEIDIMEYYRINGVPHILANTAWGKAQPWQAEWNSSKIQFRRFLRRDPNWADKFHVWRMDWDEDFIRIYLDDQLLNETRLENTYNAPVEDKINPFRQPHYILLNLAIGGTNGGEPDDAAFPLVYEVDYVRVYQKKP